MAMFCKQCGKELKDDAQFCTGCGAKVLPPEYSSLHNTGQNERASLRNDAVQKKSKLLIIVFSIAGAIAIGIAVYFIAGVMKDSKKDTVQTVTASDKTSNSKNKAASGKLSSKNSEDTLIKNDTQKLNALKIHSGGEDVTVGSWKISSDNKTLYLEANNIPSKDLTRIFDLYDAGNLSPLQKWAQAVYYIAEDLSKKLNKGWSIDVSNSCGEEYPSTLPSSDISAYSGSCGYSIPVLSGESKDNLSLIITASVFGSANKFPSGTGDYILPGSDFNRLTDSDIANLTLEQLRLARNEIYARHGYIFKSEDLRAYFSQKPWYNPDASYDGKTLSAVEKYNVELIQSREKELQ